MPLHRPQRAALPIAVVAIQIFLVVGLLCSSSSNSGVFGATTGGGDASGSSSKNSGSRVFSGGSEEVGTADSSSSSEAPGTPCSIVDDCNDRATAVSGSKEKGCVCTCTNAYLAPTCAVCPSNYDQDTSLYCSSCAAGYTEPSLGCPLGCNLVSNCSRHAESVVGNSLVGCNCTCSDNFYGDECELCPPQYSASRCRDCATGYEAVTGQPGVCDKLCTVEGNCTGINNAAGVTGYASQNCTCDCYAPWTGPECEICPQGYEGDFCEYCNSTAGYSGYPTCQLCSSATNCSSHSFTPTAGIGTCTCDCRNNWYGDKCENCPVQYNPVGAADCAICSLPDYPFGTYPNCILGCTPKNNCSNHAYTATGNPNISCSCDCRGMWDPSDNCQTCPSIYDPTADCADCIPGRWKYPNCTIAPITPEPLTPIPTPAPTPVSSQGSSAGDLTSSAMGGSHLSEGSQESSGSGTTTPPPHPPSGSGSSHPSNSHNEIHSQSSAEASSSTPASSSPPSGSSTSSSSSPPYSQSSSGASPSSSTSSSAGSSSSSSQEEKCEPWENQDWASNCTVCTSPYEWYPNCFYTVHIVGNWSVQFDSAKVDIVKLLENNLMVDLSYDLEEFVNTTIDHCGVSDHIWAWNSSFFVRDFDVLANTFLFDVDVTSYDAAGANATSECLLSQFGNEMDYQNITLTNVTKLVELLFPNNAAGSSLFTLGALVVVSGGDEPHITETNPCDPVECENGASDMRDWAAALNRDGPAEEDGSFLLWLLLVILIFLLCLAPLIYYFAYYRYKKKIEDAKTARINYNVERKLDDLEVAFCESEIQHGREAAGFENYAAELQELTAAALVVPIQASESLRGREEGGRRGGQATPESPEANPRNLSQLTGSSGSTGGHQLEEEGPEVDLTASFGFLPADPAPPRPEVSLPPRATPARVTIQAEPVEEEEATPDVHDAEGSEIDLDEI